MGTGKERFVGLIEDTGEVIKITKEGGFSGLSNLNSYFRVNGGSVFRLMGMSGGGLRLLMLVCRDCVYNTNMVLFNTSKDNYWMEELGVVRRVYQKYKREIFEHEFIFEFRGDYYVDFSFMFKGTGSAESNMRVKLGLVDGGIDDAVKRIEEEYFGK